MEKREYLGDRLKSLRTERRQTVQEVADAVGMTRSYLSGIENGHDNPGREFLVALANYYGVSTDWLMTGEGSREPGRIPLTVRAVRLIRTLERLPDEEQDHILQICEFRADRLAAAAGQPTEPHREPGPEAPKKGQNPSLSTKKRAKAK